MQKYLFIFNDSPYGNQRSYNGLRLAVSLAKSSDASVTVFLLGDGILCALTGMNPAHSDYNPQEMLRQLAGQGVKIGVCKTCMEARGFTDPSLIEVANRSTLDELTVWTEEADKVINF